MKKTSTKHVVGVDAPIKGGKKTSSTTIGKKHGTKSKGKPERKKQRLSPEDEDDDESLSDLSSHDNNPLQHQKPKRNTKLINYCEEDDNDDDINDDDWD